MVMAQIPALFLPPTRRVNVKKTSVNTTTSNKKSNNKKGSVDEQKKNDAKKCSYLLRANEEKKSRTRTSRVC